MMNLKKKTQTIQLRNKQTLHWKAYTNDKAHKNISYYGNAN